MSHDSEDDENKGLQIIRFKTVENGDDEIHLIPEEDTIKHEATKQCQCVPMLDDSIEGLEDAEFVNKKIYLHQDTYLRVYH